MISPYHEIINHEEDNWEEFFTKMYVISIFKDLIGFFQNRDQLKAGIKYIVSAYSFSSDSIVLGMDWASNKEEIFNASGLNDEYYEAFVELKSEVVLRCINDWLQFQDQEAFCQLMVLKDLKIEMQLSANSKIKKSSGEIDYDQKFKNAEYATQLTKKIKDLEDEFIQNSPKLKNIIGEAKEAIKKFKYTVGVETFAK